MAGVQLLTTEQPHFLPGYAGYLPQFRYRCGGTYGSLSHKLLLDPTVGRSPVLVLVPEQGDTSSALRPAPRDVLAVSARHEETDAVYRHPMLPTYDGSVPRMTFHYGQRYSVLATQAMAQFAREQRNHKDLLNELRGKIKSDILREDPQNPAGKLELRDQFRHSTLADQPAPVSVERCKLTLPHEKQQDAGLGSVSKPQAEPPMSIQPTGIYQKHVGLMPNYLGHVPGEIVRFGTTYGVATKDAKRWLLK